MGIFFDIATQLIGKSIKDEGSDLGKGVLNNFGKMNAITKMAKDAVHTYPVIFSEAVVANDEDLMFAICKKLEIQYAVCTMISLGLDPIFEGTSAKDHLLKVYSEENAEVITDPDAVPNSEISLSDGHCPSSLKNSDDMKPYSTESTGGQPQPPKPKEPFSSSKMDSLAKKARDSDPTIVNVKLKMAENKHEVEFPLAIKAVARFISGEESQRIFSYLRDDKPMVQIIKFLSGEIRLFRDIIFQIDRAKKDKELYSKLGRHPWFRAMIERRTKRKVNGLLQLTGVMSDFLLGKNPDILPLCSLIVTKDEIESGFSNLWANIKKSDDNIMDKLMLLGLVVVDTTTRIVEFDYYGFKNNELIRADDLIKDMGKSGKDGKDLEKLLNSLIYKV